MVIFMAINKYKHYNKSLKLLLEQMIQTPTQRKGLWVEEKVGIINERDMNGCLEVITIFDP